MSNEDIENEDIEKWVLENKILGVKGRSSIAWDLAACRYSGMSLKGAKDTISRWYYRTDYEEDVSVEFLKKFLEVLETFAGVEKENPEIAESFIALVKEEVVCEALRGKGDEWVIAALVEGSVGYHTPTDARLLVERFKKGYREDWCERCLCCYNCELDTMMFYDIWSFERLEKRDPDKVKRLIEFVKRVEKLDCEKQTMVSLAYPTMGI